MPLRSIPTWVIALVAAVAAAAAVIFGLAGGTPDPGRRLALPAPSALPVARTSHVVVVMMENKEFTDVVGNGETPFLNALIRRSGLATSMYAIRHPSLPNYLALTGGSTFGIDSDCTECHIAAPNLVDQLEDAHLSWAAYLEDQPRPCFSGAHAGGYAKKHNPFIYFDDIANDPARCRRLVPYGDLAADLRTGTLPTFAWVSPNLCDDTHDCAPRVGDDFLAHLVPALTRELGPHGLLVLTWDEGTSDAGCCAGAAGGHIATVLTGPDVRPGSRDDRPADTYSLLRTIDAALGLPPLGRAQARRPLDGLLRPTSPILRPTDKPHA